MTRASLFLFPPPIFPFLFQRSQGLLCADTPLEVVPHQFAPLPTGARTYRAPLLRATPSLEQRGWGRRRKQPLEGDGLAPNGL